MRTGGAKRARSNGRNLDVFDGRSTTEPRTPKAIIPNLEPAFVARVLCAAFVAGNDARLIGERAQRAGAARWKVAMSTSV